MHKEQRGRNRFILVNYHYYLAFVFFGENLNLSKHQAQYPARPLCGRISLTEDTGTFKILGATPTS